MRKIYIIGVMACLFTACRPSVNITVPPKNGNADFTNYLAIGDNYTAGYADNSLTVTGQLNSYPKRLFEQFSLVGAKTPFIIPLINSDNGYPGPKKILGMTYDPCNPADSSLGPIDFPGFTMKASDSDFYNSPANNGQINNIGIYGLRVVDYDVASYAALVKAGGIPYAYRFYNNRNTATPMDELAFAVHNLRPTFVTIWLGLNDVLGYAAEGGGQGDGSGNILPTSGNFFSPTDISNVIYFRKNYDSLLNVAISSGGVGGALINIPDITAYPFFTTIPANGLNLTSQTQVDNLQALYPPNPATPQFNVVFQKGANYFVIQQHDGRTRQAVPGELILLTTPLDSLKCAGWGAIKPIPAQYVLTTDELQDIRHNTTLFNSYIQQEAALHHLAYVDMYSYLSTLSTGFEYYGINYNTKFVSGGAFSLDGIHFTQRGYALIANEIISTINSFYGSTMPLVNVNNYYGIVFP